MPDQRPLDLESKLEIDGAGVDYLLRDFVDLVNNSKNFELGVTLHAQGCIISGTLISAATYISELAQLFEENMGGRIGKELKEWVAGYMPKEQADTDEPQPLPNYIHLRGARVFMSDSSVPSDSGVLWRGKLSSISGFNIGQLQIGPRKQDT